MHPLRFPNSGIRAKAFVRKIGFKLRVMRLNHVESFYAFLLRAVARRGGDCEQKHRPRAQPLAARRPRRGGRPLARRLLPAGKGSRCLRRGSGGDDAEEARGVRASF
ncbi:hypothetical protein GW17_00042301 [Ensete ventricosum]|nr:hypothetical protein GW17_00042301 [Ensete ventricosum]